MKEFSSLPFRTQRLYLCARDYLQVLSFELSLCAIAIRTKSVLNRSPALNSGTGLSGSARLAIGASVDRCIRIGASVACIGGEVA